MDIVELENEVESVTDQLQAISVVYGELQEQSYYIGSTDVYFAM